jgi:hypothetical protein
MEKLVGLARQHEIAKVDAASFRWVTRELRTLEDVLREFDQDKWGPLHVIAERGEFKNIRAFESAAGIGTETVYCRAKGDLFAATYSEAYDVYACTFGEVLASYATHSDLIIEVGAGYGALAFRLLEMPEFRNHELLALDVSQSGLQVMSSLAKQLGVKAIASVFDIHAPHFPAATVGRRPLVLVSNVLMYASHQLQDFYMSVAALEPSIVVIVEPIAEDLQDCPPLQEAAARYLTANRYYSGTLRDLMDCISRDASSAVGHEADVFSFNVACPNSRLVWVKKS